MSRRAELLEELDNLEVKLKDVKKELAVELGLLDEEEPKAVKTPALKRASLPRPKKVQDDEEEKVTLQSVVLSVLKEAGQGMTLNDIREAVDKIVKAGGYKTKAGKLTPVISQALHQLQQQDPSPLRRERNPENRFLYSLAGN